VQVRDGRTRALRLQVRVRGLLGLAQISLSTPAPLLGGLSQDARTLVLQAVPGGYPTAVSRFVVVDASGRRPPREVRLRGSFAFDALSPDGRALYLVQDLRSSLFQTYAVRVYDLATRRLDPRPLVDRREHEWVMQGRPLARATSRRGDWVYTLYAGGPHPFVHALHASARAAVCIDLPRGVAVLPEPGLWLASHDTRLVVVARGRRVATIDAGRLRVLRGAARPQR
jgi:hypothetical protein